MSKPHASTMKKVAHKADNLNIVCKWGFRGKYNVAFKRGQRVLAHFAERSNEKELNAEITLFDNSYCIKSFSSQ